METNSITKNFLPFNVFQQIKVSPKKTNINYDDTVNNVKKNYSKNLPFTGINNDFKKHIEYKTERSDSLLSKLDYAKREGGTSSISAFVNFFKGMIGPGCLLLPMAFKEAGLVAGLIMVIVFGYLNYFCMLQLVHCSQKLSRKKGDTHMDYGTLAYEACNNSFPFMQKYKFAAKTFVNTCIIFLQFGICSAFYVFIAKNLYEINKEEFFKDLFFFSEKQWMVIILIPVILISFIRKLRVIAILSAIGNILVIVVFIFMMQFLLREEHHWSNLKLCNSFSGIMRATGSILYAFEGQAMVLPLENKLKNPKKMVSFFGVLSFGMGAVTFVYASIGLVGYITYGKEVKESITSNLPKNDLFFVLKIIWTVIVYFTYLIQQYVIIKMTWPSLKKKLKLEKVEKNNENFCNNSLNINNDNESNFSADRKNSIEKPSIDSTITAFTTSIITESKLVYYCELLYRIVIVIITMTVGILISNLTDIVSIVGVTSGMFLAIIIPASLDTILFLPAYMENTDGKIKGKTLFVLIRNICLCLIGLFGLVFGLKSSIEKIIQPKTNV